jgi:2-dehydro-3-deoxyphosphooctonate aldolase (KDO 8-P synthase)
MLASKKKFIFIAGPCVIETQKLTLNIASYLKDLTMYLPVTFIFKASFDKANRTSLRSFRGPGLIKGIKILEKIKQKLDVPILSDIHCRHQIKFLKDILDIIQIPAFLCRQTDLILEVAKTKKIVNIKKGQFISPQDVGYIVEKIESTGNKNIFITERGTCFGYNNLVVDFRSFLMMKKFGYPIIYDVTHSLQKPSLNAGVSGGDSQFIEPLSLAATASGIDGLFMEVHPNPKNALSDKHTSCVLSKVRPLLDKVLKIKEITNGQV